MTSEMFVSAVRSSGDLAGVFEYTDLTGYFYLYDQTREKDGIRTAVHILSGDPDFDETDIEVLWSPNEEVVGLFIRGRLWAACRGEKAFGGDYRRDGQPRVPEAIAAFFTRPP